MINPGQVFSVNPETGLPRVHFSALTPEGVVRLRPDADGIHLEFHSYGDVLSSETIPWEKIDEVRERMMSSSPVPGR